MITFDEYMAGLPEERQKAIQQEADEIIFAIHIQQEGNKQDEQINDIS